MATKFTHHMSDSDALMWNIEKDPVLRSTIVACGTLDRAPDWDRVRRRLEHASVAIPRMRQRVLSPPLRIGPPRWTFDPDFDLDYHLRRVRLPDPGSRRLLFDLLAPMASASFDRARPLWECTVIEGLEHDQAAIVLKVHHSVTDGVGGVALLAHLVDIERDAEGPDRLPYPPAPERFSALGLVRDSLSHSTRRALGIARRTPNTVIDAALNAARDPLAAGVGAVDTIRSIGRILAPATAPMSPVMQGRGLGRRLDAFDVPMDDMKRAAKAVNGSLNDAFVAAVIGGLMRYHERYGASPDELRMTMPISIRTSGHEAGGNQFAPARFPVPTHHEDPADRMRHIRELVQEWRHEPAIGLTDALAGVLNRLPTATTTALFGGMLECVDFVTSNVPGAPIPVFAGGAQIERFYAFGPPSGAGVNITLMSHIDTCCIGIVSDTTAITHPEDLVDDLKAGFAQVVALG